MLSRSWQTSRIYPCDTNFELRKPVTFIYIVQCIARSVHDQFVEDVCCLNGNGNTMECTPHTESRRLSFQETENARVSRGLSKPPYNYRTDVEI